MPLESTIQSSILKYLNSLPDCVAENVSGNAAQSGRPDINACIEGCSYRIEVKSPDHGYMPSKKQITNLKRWARAGAICVVVWSLDEVKFIVKKKGAFSSKFTGWYIFEDGAIWKGSHPDD
jgi:hypothetical protein